MSLDTNVLIVGAGSIGAHLARSSSKRGWGVEVVDISPEAVSRFSQDLYPTRYGVIPSHIQVGEPALAEGKTYDLVFIGTPPDSHAQVLEQYVSQAGRAISIQKPITTYRKSEISRVERIVKEHDHLEFLSGFTHRVSSTVRILRELFRPISAGQRIEMEVNWLESWDGILKAHPWLASPADSYLGHFKRGGGALFEHSHGLDLGLSLMQEFTGSAISGIEGESSIIEENSALYDQSVTVFVDYINGSTLRVRHDVATWPAEKSIKVNAGGWQGKVVISNPESLQISCPSGQVDISANVNKFREEDFDAELREVALVMASRRNAAHDLNLASAIITSKVSSFIVGRHFGISDDVFTHEDLIKEGLIA